MKNIKSNYLIASGVRCLTLMFCLLICQTVLQAQTLTADYQFQGNLNSSVGSAPPIVASGNVGFLTDNIDGYTRQSLRFEAGSGLGLNTLGLAASNSYTVVMLFRFDNVTSTRRRVFDSTGGASNLCGLYIANSRLEPEPTTVTNIIPSTYIQVSITRDANGTARFTRDGLNGNVGDANGCYLNQNNFLRFFLDDTATPGEVSAGNIARIRVFNGAMTFAQIHALDRLPNANGGGDQAILFVADRHNNAEIFSMNANGTSQRRLTNNTVSDTQARWSPDKSKIVFNRAEKIWIMNADGSGQTQLTSAAANDHVPSFKPDGSKILFTRCPTSQTDCDIYTMNADGTNQQAFNGAAVAGTDEDFADYSPDGSRIIYTLTSFTNNTSGLATTTGSGGGIQYTSNPLPASDISARFSPDGSKLAFVRSTNIINPTATTAAANEIYTMASQGSVQTNITNNAVNDNIPVWLPNNQRLAFHTLRYTPGTAEIATIDEAGGNATRVTFSSSTEIMCDFYQNAVISRTPFDFDSDGKADVSVFRPSNGLWYLNQSSAGFTGIGFGQAGDKLVPADYDGDGKTDVAVVRNGVWYLLRSSLGFTGITFGAADDIPQPADFDGDSKAELAVFRPSNGYWYILNLTSNQFTATLFGISTDKPVPADYDGDGKTDIAVNRNGNWYLQRSSLGFTGIQFGDGNDKSVPADYDGDGKADIAVFRPSSGNWYLLQSTAGFAGIAFGLGTDIPVAADYDGDGKADVAVVRNGNWYLNRSTQGFTGIQFGTNTDLPIPNAFVK